MRNDLDRKSNQLTKARLPNPELVSNILQSLNIPSFDELTAINQKHGTTEFCQINKVIDLLAKASEDFLKVDLALSDIINLRLNPMDIVYEALKNALPESSRILITNLDKMKFALPLVIPNHSMKPKIKMWPLIGISRQTAKGSFDLFNDKHHVIAVVRLGDCHGFEVKLSTLSKSEILNEMFFEGQNRFLSRRHAKMSKTMKKNQLGSIETCIHTPNEKLNNFLQIWNLQGNIFFEGLEAQIKLINCCASIIIVVLDDDTNLQNMNLEIEKKFNGNQRIIVLIRKKIEDDDTYDSENDDDVNFRTVFPNFDAIQFNNENIAEMYERTRSLISNYCSRESNFTLQSIENNDHLQSLFDMDLHESILQAPKQKIDSIFECIKKIHHKSNDIESLQRCFPLYFSRSSIDKSKKIVEHIEILEKTKVQFFRQHQRGEFEMENKIDEQIDCLRRQQSQIANQSTLAVRYLNDITDLQKTDVPEISNEKIRLYHKGLSFQLAQFNKDGMDIVGFQRELGQRFIAIKNDDERKMITKTLQIVVEAGVSIELIDGDTQSLNKEIIVSLLDHLR